MNFQPKHFPALAIKTETKHSIDCPVCSKDRATEAKHTVYRVDGKTTISIGFTNSQGSATSGGLDKTQFRTLIKVLRNVFGDIFNEKENMTST